MRVASKVTLNSCRQQTIADVCCVILSKAAAKTFEGNETAKTSDLVAMA